MSRRELLKRGAALGAAAWAVPVVQAVGMRTAQAQSTSPACVTFCLKWEVDQNTFDELTGVWSNIWTGLGGATSQGNCLACPGDAVNAAPPMWLLDDLEVTGDTNGFTVTFPATCTLPDPGTESGTPDEFYGNGAAAAKCGSSRVSGLDSCRFLTADDIEEVPGDPTRRRLFFARCANNRGISHLELILRCCE